MANGFKIADAYVEIHADDDTARRDVDSLGAKLSPSADRSGRKVGDKLSQGMHLAIIRNSPLIAAGIGAALAAGAPAALAGATALFGGIGALAAAQSDRVQSAWLGAWQQIKGGAIADASSLVPVYERMADKVAAGFDKMRPKIRAAFEASGPLVDHFTDSVLRAANNALPGLVRAVERGQPVIEGMGSFLEKLGTGVSDMFDRMSTHSVAAGRVWDSLGDSMAALLPLLGELLGQGVELASMVLPMLSGSLGLVLKVATALGPVLPVLAAGFGAMKIAKSVTGMVGGLAGTLGEYAAKGGLASGVAGKLSGGLGAISGAAGPAAFGIGFVVTAVTLWLEAGKKAEEMHMALGRAMATGGDQAAAAAKLFDRFNDSFGGKLMSVLPEGVKNFKFLGTSLADILPSAENARNAYDKWYDSLDRVGQLQEDVKRKTDALKTAVDEHGAKSQQAKQASGELADAERKLAAEEGKLEKATRGVTEAMTEQANAARARVDSSFAYENALNGVEDAAKNLADAQAHLNDKDKATRTSQEDVSRAALALNEAYDAQVEAAGRVAQSDLPAAMDDQQKAILGAKGELDELNKLISQGVKLPPSMEAYRQQLIRITGQADGATLAQAQLAGAVGELGFAVEAVPGEKTVTIHAPTDEVRKRLTDLGFTIVELPNGDVTVEARTDEAKKNVGNLSALLTGVDKMRPTPVANLNLSPFSANFFTGLKNISTLNAQRPVPVANMNLSPFSSNFFRGMSQIGTLARQRPTPVATMNAGPFSSTMGWLFGRVASINGQRPTPIARLIAATSGAESQLNWAARNRTTTIYAVYRALNSIPLLGGLGRASGGKIGFDSGGKVRGPGGPTDDLISVRGPRPDVDYRLSNLEWVIKAASSMMYGDQAMKDLNDGLATVITRSGRRIEGRAGGGSMADGGTPTVTATRTGATISVGDLHVHVTGMFDMTKPGEMRRMAVELRKQLVALEREYR